MDVGGDDSVAHDAAEDDDRIAYRLCYNDLDMYRAYSHNGELLPPSPPAYLIFVLVGGKGEIVNSFYKNTGN